MGVELVQPKHKVYLIKLMKTPPSLIGATSISLTKDHLINSVSNHLGLPKRGSAALVESTLEIIRRTLENGEDVLIIGFGKFSVKE